MIVLDSTRALTITVTGNADALVCGGNKSATGFTPLLQQAPVTAGGSPNTIKAAPAASSQDELDLVVVTDTSGAANTMTLKVTGGITTVFPAMIVPAGGALQYVHGQGVSVLKKPGARKYGQALSGTIDGSNAIFTAPENFVAGSAVVFKNGVRQLYTRDYTETGANEITYSVAATPQSTPSPGDDHVIDYDQT